MFDLAREIIGNAADPRDLPRHRPRLSGRPDQHLGGFSLGVGAVLFVGLAIGAFAPKAQITGPIGLTGLIMFLYGIGILYGRQFFEGMTGAAGRKYNLLALVAVVAGLLVALGLGQDLRHQGRPHAGHLRRLDDQHRDPAGRARRDAQQRAVDRLFGRLSVRRDRPDPVHLFHDAAGAAEVSRRRRSASTWARSRSAAAAPGARSASSSSDLPSGVQVTMVRKEQPEHRPVDRARAGRRRRR